jgi:type IV secretory pathway VirJ component
MGEDLCPQQVFAKYAHTWDKHEFAVTGFSIGRDSIGVQWTNTTTEKKWEKSTDDGAVPKCWDGK